MKVLISLVGGLVSSTAFAPFELWISTFLGLFVWFYALDTSNKRNQIFGSYLFGLGLLLPSQYWTGIYVGSFPWLALCFMQALFFVIPALFFNKSDRYKLLIFASSYVLVELLLRTVPFTGFGWSRLSYTQTDSPFSVLYPIGGVVLVAWVIALLVAIRSLGSLIIVVAILFLSSLIPKSVQSTGEVKIALVQGGVSNLGLDFNSKPREVFLRHLDQTRKLNEDVELIIWPENAVDIDVKTNKDVYQQIVDASKLLETPLLVGGVTKSSAGLNNQSMFFTPELTQIYTKRYLTPFGEYLPMRSIATKLSPYANEINDFVAGTRDEIFKVNDKSFQVLICYEVINDSFRDQISSSFIVVQTNNATFGDTAQLDQELVIAKVRALETGRSIAYVSTTGVTSFITDDGEIISYLEKFKQSTLVDRIQTVEGMTITQTVGKYLEPLLLSLMLLLLLRRVRRNG
jgi:apolipoprotein N-acyltransferase